MLYKCQRSSVNLRSENYRTGAKLRNWEEVTTTNTAHLIDTAATTIRRRIEMGTLGRAFYTVGFLIRETGQALDRLGSRLQGNYFFQEQRTFHSRHFSIPFQPLHFRIFVLLPLSPSSLRSSYLSNSPIYRCCTIRVWRNIFAHLHLSHRLILFFIMGVSIYTQYPGIDLLWMYSTKLLTFTRRHLWLPVPPSLVMFRLANLLPFGMDVFSEVNH